MLPVLVRAESEVTVYYPHQYTTIQVNDAGNLAQLIMRPAINGRTWWPATIISTPQATVAARVEKQALLAGLQQLADRLSVNDDPMAGVVRSVWRQVNVIRVTGRQIVKLDPDWVRLRPEDNRRLQGRYQLYTATRPDSVQLAGVVSQPGTVPWQPGKTVADYLATTTRVPGAERNVALLITPEGTIQKVPVAYWNRRHVEPPAGSIIFVGFGRWSLPEDEAVINRRFLSVLTHRIPD